MLRPYPLSAVRIEAAALAVDKKRCRKIGPCGVGKQALYLNSYFQLLFIIFCHMYFGQLLTQLFFCILDSWLYHQMTIF